MARTLLAKATPDLIREAERLKRLGRTMKEIGAALGIFAATASYWSRGVTAAPEYKQAFRREADKRRRVRLLNELDGGQRESRADMQFARRRGA